MANIGAAKILPLASYRPVATEVLNTEQILCGLPRGGITEIIGSTSTGRTSLAQAIVATATEAGEVAAFVDCSDSFDPASARSGGVKLGKLLWVQCGHRPESALRATDIILHSGGFGLIVLDLCDAPAHALDRIPISSWYRFQRAIEHTPSILLILARQSIARSCAARQLAVQQRQLCWRGEPPFQTIERLDIGATSRKPVTSAPIELEAWAEA